jgi:outer membrane protein TolC
MAMGTRAVLALVALLGSSGFASSEAQKTAATQAVVQTLEIVAPPRVRVETVSLEEAVRLTLIHDPQIHIQRQETAAASGRRQEATGFFDTLVRALPEYSYTQNEIGEFQKGQEFFKREFLQRLGEEMGKVTLALEDALRQNLATPPRCPEGLDVVLLTDNILEREDVLARTGLAVEDTIVVIPLDLAGDTADVLQICIPALDLKARQETMLDFLGELNRIADLNLDNVFATSAQLPREILLLVRDISDAVATRSQLAFERLGSVPEQEITKTISISASFFKPMRSGLTLSLDLRLQSRERNFRDKPLDPAFGGEGIRNEFPSLATVSLMVPLGRGRGSVSAAAPERAAQLSASAEQDLLRHRMSEEVFGTVLAYLNLDAAQQSLSLLEESSARQSRLADLTRQLVEAGESPAIQLDRGRARASAVAGAVAEARRAVITARLVLANAIGLEVYDLGDAPLASQVQRASVEAGPKADALVRQAFAQRRDLTAVGRFRNASQVLTAAAKADLKRRFDLSLSGGLSTLYESPFFRVVPQEEDPPPRTTYVDYFAPAGYWRSVNGAWEPFVRAELSFDVPFGNNFARGRLLQQESSQTMSEIRLRDLERLIRQNVIELLGTLQKAGEALTRRREAVGYYEQTLANALAGYETGDINLVDMLLTEEELTREKTELVRATQLYLSLLARLKFETGELVRFRGEGTPQEVAEFGGLGPAAR